jgi:hypothetical protein
MNCSLNFFFETRTNGPDLIRLTDCPDYSSPSSKIEHISIHFCIFIYFGFIQDLNSNPNYCQISVNNEKFDNPDKGGRWCFIGTTASNNLKTADLQIQGQISIVASENVKDSFWSNSNFPKITVIKSFYFGITRFQIMTLKTF